MTDQEKFERANSKRKISNARRRDYIKQKVGTLALDKVSEGEYESSRSDSSSDESLSRLSNLTEEGEKDYDN